MKNIGLVIAGILIWFFMKNKELVQGWLESIFGERSSSKTAIEKETVTQEKTRNNLGMSAPNLDYLGNSISYMKTNPKYDIVNREFDKDETLINREFVSMSRTAPAGISRLSPDYKIPTNGGSSFNNWFAKETVASYNPFGTSFKPKLQFGF